MLSDIIFGERRCMAQIVCGGGGGGKLPYGIVNKGFFIFRVKIFYLNA